MQSVLFLLSFSDDWRNSLTHGSQSTWKAAMASYFPLHFPLGEILLDVGVTFEYCFCTEHIHVCIYILQTTLSVIAHKQPSLDPSEMKHFIDTFRNSYWMTSKTILNCLGYS